MGKKKTPMVYPGEEICGCVEIGRVPDDHELFAEICACMYTQDPETGDSVCRRCKGDIYACDCALAHSPKCKESGG